MKKREKKNRNKNKKKQQSQENRCTAFPSECLTQILHKLPIETIFLCRVVCKSWYHTIKSPHFIKIYNTNIIRASKSPFVISHDEFLPQNSVHFHLLDLDRHDEISLTLYQIALRPPRPISHIYCCNGWVLALSISGRFYSDSPLQPYFICNPITGEHRVVPISPCNKSPAVIGFGWDSVSKVFKVVRISDDNDIFLTYIRGTILEVYNVRTNKWRVVKWTRVNQEPCRASSILRSRLRLNTYLNGRLHWISYLSHGFTATIISFKLDTEEFQHVSMPLGLVLDPNLREPRSFYFPHGYGIPRDTGDFDHYLLALGECLALVNCVGDNHVEIYVMKEYGLGSSWEKKYIIKNIVSNNFSPVKGPYQPIKLVHNEEILMLCSDQNLGYYHVVTKVFRLVGIGDVLYRPSASKPPLHVGSLLYITNK